MKVAKEGNKRDRGKTCTCAVVSEADKMLRCYVF